MQASSSLKVDFVTEVDDAADVVEAIDWAIDNDMDVINMSLGSPFGAADTADALAAQALRRGELLGLPTETVYGLGARADAGTVREGCARAEVVVDCRGLRRLDFVAAGELLNEVVSLRTGGKGVSASPFTLQDEELAMMLAARGAALTVAQNQSVGVSYDNNFITLGQGNWLGFPIPAGLMFAAFIVGFVLLHYTSFGRHVLAIGGNEDASRLMGLPVGRVTLLVYVMSGFLAGLAGLILASQFGAGQRCTVRVSPIDPRAIAITPRQPEQSVVPASRRLDLRLGGSGPDRLRAAAARWCDWAA